MTSATQQLSSDCSLYTVIKGGLSVIVSPIYSTINWSAVAADYILSYLLQSKKYSKIIIINYDKGIIEENSTKIDNVNGYDLYNDSMDNIDYSKLMEILNNNCNSSTAVMLYSVSEVLLTIGLNNTIILLNTLSDHCNKESLQSPTPVITVMHQSLHSPLHAQLVTRLASVIVKVVPNKGTISEEVAAEVQTIRISPNTGKTVESIEMFGFNSNGFLIPIQSIHNYTNNPDDSAIDGDNTIAGKDAMEGALQDSSSSNSNTERNANNGSRNSSSNSGGLKRLITFDSTDPEFDEDSDPDADLDL